MAEHGPPSQDELALTRQDLRHAQQQLLKEAAEQEPNQVLVKACEHLIHNLTAREERLMEEARAMRLEARAPDVEDQSISFCEQLLEVKLTRLPEDAEQLQALLESGTVSVTQVTFQHLTQKYSDILTAGEGLLAQHFSCCIAGGFLDARGQSEEATAHITLKAIVETWHYIWRFAPMDHRLTYLWGKNQGLGSVDRSTHDPSRGKVRPDLTIVASKLLLFVGEEKTAKAGLAAAYADVKKKFQDGLSPMYYQGITFIPFMIAAGNEMRFGMLHRNGELELCSHTFDVTVERDRVKLMQSALNLYRLLLVLTSQAPDIHLRKVQGVEELRPENTSIIRHVSCVEKIIYLFDDFVEKFGHSFEDIKAAYANSTGHQFMVQAQPPKLSRPVPAGTKRQRGEPYYKVVITRIGADSPDIETLTETEMKKVLKAGLHCAQLLAGTDLVHRDLRLPNFFWDKDTPFVGDLELAAKAPLQVVRKQLPTLKDWTDGTLDADGNYTTGSDVHQLGILLEKWLSSSIAASADSSGQASDLLNALKSKVDAYEALHHVWLTDVP